MKRMDVSQLLEFCGDADIAQAEDITASLCHSLEALGVLVADHLGVDFAGIEQSADGVLAGFVPRQPGDRCPAVLADCDEDGVWPGSPLRTLLVYDDDHGQTLLARHAVSDPGIRVIEVHSAEEAWQAYQSNPVDVVVTNIGLPGCNGMELLRRIVSQTNRVRRGRPRKVPVITTSGAEFDDVVRHEIDQAGGVVHLKKPVDWARLAPVISALCQVS